MSDAQGAQRHFARVAPVYQQFRNTDPDVVDAIIAHFPRADRPLQVADIGCGTGRYSDVIAARLNGTLCLWCCDFSMAMLAACRSRLGRDFPMKDVRYCRVHADHLPFGDGVFNAVVTFNAVHHFHLDRFVTAAARVLRPGGLLSIYTRTPEQNARTIWGRHFPSFTHYESRLFPRRRLEEAVRRLPALMLEGVREFRHERVEPAASLLERARNFHYSTFALYPPGEFADALAAFAAKLPGLGNNSIMHSAENILLLARRTCHSALSTDVSP